jgi:enoyl-CoA hydratase/carnithine racemase
VKLVILKGHGRAFCAGGDVAAVVRDINQGLPPILFCFLLSAFIHSFSIFVR